MTGIRIEYILTIHRYRQNCIFSVLMQKRKDYGSESHCIIEEGMVKFYHVSDREEELSVTIAEKNAQRWAELSDVNENLEALHDWACHTVRSVKVEYVDYVGSYVQGVWDISDEKGSLFPSNASYTPLLEKM